MKETNRSAAHKGLHLKNTARTRMAQAISLAVLSTAGVGALAQTELATTKVGTTDDDGYRVERAQSFKYSQPLVETPKTLTIISSAVTVNRESSPSPVVKLTAIAFIPFST